MRLPKKPMRIAACWPGPSSVGRGKVRVLDPAKPRSYNVYDRAHADLREFIERTRAADELLLIKGANWNLEIGALAEIVNHAKSEPPAILFEDIPGYPKGMRL